MRLPGLIFISLVIAVVPALISACSVEAERPNLLLILIDTCRVDRMSLHGNPVATTPSVDKIAASGVVFEQAITHVPQTLPATSTLLTSTLPVVHGVRVNGLFDLPEEMVTLAEVFKDERYQTGAIISGFTLDERFGLAQGFDHYDCDFSDSVTARTNLKRRHLEQRADEAADKAMEWLRAYSEKGSDEPFFLFVHFFDPHAPYVPPEDFSEKFAPYDGELAMTDRHIGRLVDTLEELEINGNTLVVIAGDHGERMDPDQSNGTHAGFLDETVLRVPLVLRFPGRITPGVRIAEQVGLVDVAPTVLELLEIEAPEAFLGESLVPLLHGGVKKHTLAVFETLYWKLEKSGTHVLFGTRNGRFKYIHDTWEDEEGEHELRRFYDLAEDPNEEMNLFSNAHREKLRNNQEYIKVLRKCIESTNAYKSRKSKVKMRVLKPDEEERLRSLGYL